MPEGDTLLRLAMRLRPVLGGQTLVAATSLGAIAADTLAGLAVRDVEVRGKHLMIHLGDDSTLHIHLGMSGRFFVNALNEPGLRAAVTASLVLETATHRVVGTGLPVLERLTAGKLLRHPQISRLGPDLLAERFNLDDELRRTRRGSSAERYFVYGRVGAPCFECGTAIERSRQGDLARSTYFCPTCQGVQMPGRPSA